MLELSDFVVILGLLLLTFLIFLRLLFAGMKRLLPALVPQLMEGVGDNIPNISPKQAIGLLALEFVKSGGVQMLMQKFMGMPPGEQPPQLPPGGQ